MKFIRLHIFNVLVLFYSLHPHTCSGQYILGHTEPPGNYVFQVLLEEDEAIQHVFAECDKVISRDIKLTFENKRYFKDMHGIDIKEDHFKVYTGLKGNRVARHAIILDCMGCFRPITFILSVKPDGWINDLNVMIYREARGGEALNERFLGQFTGKNIETLESIDTAVTGATASAQCLCDGTRKGLLLLQEFFLNKRFKLDKSNEKTDKVDFSSNKNAEAIDGYLTAFTRMQFIENTTAIVSILHSSERKVAEVIEEAFTEMKRVNNLINKETGKLNRKGRRKFVEYSEEFTNLISLCKKYSEETHGIFDITVPDKNKKTSYKDIMLDVNRIAFANKKTQIDISLVEKGFVIDIGIEILKKNGISIAAINYGDNTRVIGKPPGEGNWKIGIRYLDEKDLILGHVSLTDKAISVLVNQNYYKLNTIRVKEVAQLISQITNVPVDEKQWAAVICAESALDASVFSYVALVSDLDESLFANGKIKNIEYAMIYDNSEGILKAETSKWMKDNFYQKIGSIYDYGKDATCACSVTPCACSVTP